MVQAAVSGGAITYAASNPTEEGAPGYAESVQVLSTRGGHGWSSTDIVLPHSTPAPPVVGRAAEYRFFSEDLSLAVVEPFGPFTSLQPEVFPPDSQHTPYLRHDSTCASEPGTCYEPLATGCPAETEEGEPCPPLLAENADVPPGTKVGGTFEGATPDAQHVIVGGLAEWSAASPAPDRLALVSLLPPTKQEEAKGEPGKLAPASSLGSARGGDARGAISKDGSRIVWTNTDHLYLRDMTLGKTVQLDVPEAGCVAAEACGEGEATPVFQIASDNGARVFFTDTQKLTEGSGAASGKPDLYMCEVPTVPAGGNLECKLTDLTPANSGESGAVKGTVIGASEDGSWVYFTADGMLPGTAAQGATPGNCTFNGQTGGAGACNLYLWHEGVTRLVALLGGEDFPDWSNELSSLTARVSPDGRYLAFTSDRSLTGYDTRDAVTGKPDEEVYLYHAPTNPAGEPGSLVCASCDPTGARPAGVPDSQLEKGIVGLGQGSWGAERGVAGSVPGWPGSHQSRYLSNEGRLFFDSSDALVPQDINGNEDVYEYEPPAGVSGASPNDTCTPAGASASSVYSPASGGCVSLISSGTGAGESGFLDASENGEDVFFVTAQSLVPRDRDTAFDVYDAHVCTTAEPCPSHTAPEQGCTTADACRTAPAPEPEVFADPPSATFNGPGNISPEPEKTITKKVTKKTVKCKKPKKLSHNKCVKPKPKMSNHRRTR